MKIKELPELSFTKHRAANERPSSFSAHFFTVRSCQSHHSHFTRTHHDDDEDDCSPLVVALAGSSTC